MAPFNDDVNSQNGSLKHLFETPDGSCACGSGYAYRDCCEGEDTDRDPACSCHECASTDDEFTTLTPEDLARRQADATQRLKEMRARHASRPPARPHQPTPVAGGRGEVTPESDEAREARLDGLRRWCDQNAQRREQGLPDLPYTENDDVEYEWTDTENDDLYSNDVISEHAVSTPTPAPIPPEPRLVTLNHASCCVCGGKRTGCVRIEGVPMAGTVHLCSKVSQQGTVVGGYACCGPVNSGPLACVAEAFKEDLEGGPPLTVYVLWTTVQKQTQEAREEEEARRLFAPYIEAQAQAKQKEQPKEPVVPYTRPPNTSRFPDSWWSHCYADHGDDATVINASVVSEEVAAFFEAQSAAEQYMRPTIFGFEDAICVVENSDPKPAPNCRSVTRAILDPDTNELRTIHPRCKCNQCDYCWAAKRLGWLRHGADVLTRAILPTGLAAASEGNAKPATMLPFRTGNLYCLRCPAGDRDRVVRSIRESAKRLDFPNPGWSCVRQGQHGVMVFVVAEVPFGTEGNRSRELPAHMVASEWLSALGEVPRGLGKGHHLVDFRGRWSIPEKEPTYTYVEFRVTVAEALDLAEENDVVATPSGHKNHSKVTTGVPGHPDDWKFRPGAGCDAKKWAAFIEALRRSEDDKFAMGFEYKGYVSGKIRDFSCLDDLPLTPFEIEDNLRKRQKQPPK